MFGQQSCNRVVVAPPNFNYHLFRCLATREDLDQQPEALFRSTEHTANCIDSLSYKDAWDKYGIIGDVQVRYHRSTATKNADKPA